MEHNPTSIMTDSGGDFQKCRACNARRRVVRPHLTKLGKARIAQAGLPPSATPDSYGIWHGGNVYPNDAICGELPPAPDPAAPRSQAESLKDLYAES